MENESKYQNVLNTIEYYEKIGYFKGALDICARVEYLDVPIIQSKRLYILTKKLDDYERAYTIFRQVKKMKDPDIQSIGIQILSTLGLHDEIKRLIIENGNIESNNYKYTLMEYYINRRQYDKALDICNEPFCASQEVFKNHKKYIKKLKYRTREGLVYEFLMRIYADDITIDEIKKANIKENIDPNASDIDKKKARIMEYFKKDILIIAYYEKYNRKQAIEECKRSKKNSNYDKEQLKSLNIILNHLMSKKNKMDYDLYKYILGVSFDWEEVHKYMEAKKEQEEYQELMNSIIKKVKQEEKPSIKIDNIADSKLIEKTKKVERKVVGVTGVNVNSRHSNNNINIVNAPVHVPEKKVTLIKDEYAYELEELQRALYCMMKPGNMTDEDINRLMSYYKFVEAEELKKYAKKLEKNENALRDKMPIPKTPLGMVLKAYDNLEALADNPITNKEKLMRFLSILLKAGTSEDVSVYNAENKSFDKKPSDKIIDINTDRILKEYNKLKIK